MQSEGEEEVSSIDGVHDELDALESRGDGRFSRDSLEIDEGLFS